MAQKRTPRLAGPEGETPPAAPPPAASGKQEATVPPVRTCGTMQVHRRLLSTNAEYVRRRAASETYAHTFARMTQQARTGVTMIPVVVHVVYNQQHPEQNISDEQIQSQIAVLNKDYRKKNPDVSQTPAPYLPLTEDARIEFVLADKDPNGAASNGITRTSTNVATFADDDSVKSAATGGVAAWPADKYLNIWVCPLGNNLLGYAQFPGGPAQTDGVVILYSAFGTTGTAAAPFNLGRTATHEIGHWLNLRHIWGDDGNGCNGSDFVDDTPNQGGPNFGKPAFPHVTCNNGPNGDMFMNYMDYVDDAAMIMFTQGQVARVQACLDGDRSTIGTVKAEPATLKFNDDQVTLKFNDDQVTLKFNDDQVTLKFRDDVPPPTLKFRDDMPPPTLKFRDDGGGTLKALDDPIKPPLQDAGKLPAQDMGKVGGGDQIDPGIGIQFGGAGRAAPFILATPHHSMAWTRSYPGAAQSAAAAYEAQIREYEQQLDAYAQGEATGALTPADIQMANALYDEYMQLVAEYGQMTGR